jgi:hypothetical protein
MIGKKENKEKETNMSLLDKSLTELESVGSCIDTKTGMVYPMYEDGTHDEECGGHLEDTCDEWFDSLSVEDKVIVDGVLESI